MKKLKKRLQSILEFLGFWLILFTIFNISFYVFGLFYYLQFDPILWSAKARGVISLMNIFIMGATYLGFVMEPNNEKE